MSLLENAFDIFMSTDCVTVGMAVRISMCNQALKELIMNHFLFWKALSHQLEYKRARDGAYILNALATSNRCRECGQKAGLRTLTTSCKKMVTICMKCSQDEHGYNELVSRAQILSFSDWSNKRKFLLQNRYRARWTRNKKYLYWGFLWRQPNFGQSRLH